MSGGTFDYKQYAIIEIIEKLEEEQGNHHSDNVQMVFTHSIKALKRAYTFSQCIDWYLAGDDTEESLFKRLFEELAELENNNEKI